MTGLQEPRLSDLQLTGIDLPDFSSDQLDYDVVRPAGGLAMTTVVATPQAPATGGDVTILPPDADPVTTGHQVALARGEPTEVQINVVHPVTGYEVAYKVTVAPDAELAPSGVTTVATAAGVELHWLAPARESATVTGYAVRRQHLVRRETELTTLTLRAAEVGVALDHAERRLRRRGDCHLNSLLDVSAAAPSGSAAGYPRSRGVAAASTS